MKIFRNISLLLLGLFLSQVAAAQTVLTGTVKDKATGAALTGANVYVSSTNNRFLAGGVVDGTGQYRVTIPADAGDGLTVVFSFVGYTTQNVPYTSQRTINMLLEQEARVIGTSTIVGKREPLNAVGLTERESSASTQTITLERLESAPVSNIVDALQGSMANVDIVTGADPGARATIRMRGITSFTSNVDPLIVLDGVPLPESTSEDFNFATANTDDFGQLLNISPVNIESITALKDAAATAVWGSRGAAGVIEIVTKKGQQGRIRVQFTTDYQFQKERSSIPLLNGRQYVSLMQDEIWNRLLNEGYGNSDLTEMLFNTPEINYDPSWVYFNEYNQDTKWIDEVVQTGHTLDTNISVSGGGEKTNYRLNVGYLTETGTTIGTDLNRLSLKFNMQYNFSNKFRITTDFDFSQSARSSNYGEDGVPSARGATYTKMPNMSPYALDDNGNRTSDYFTPYENFQGSFNDGKQINPAALVHESFGRSKENRNRVVFTAQYYFIPGVLFYDGILGLDITGSKTNGFLPQSVTGVTWIDPAFNKSYDNSTDTFALTTSNKLTFRKTFNEVHTVNASMLLRTSDQQNSTYSSSVGGNASGGMTDPVVGGKIVGMNSGFSQTRNITGNLSTYYAYKNRYAVTANFNYEARSSMAKNARSLITPQFGVVWHFGDEKWFDPIRDVIFAGKFRANWGRTGNAPGGSGKYFGTFRALSTGYINMAAIEPASVQLNNLKYEIVDNYTVGLDLELFEGRLSTTAEYYYKKTNDLRQDNPSVPSSTGYSSVAYINSGILTNEGWEFRFNYDVIKKDDWGLNLDFNISQNQNEIVEMPQYKLLTDYTLNNGNYASKIVLGNPIGSFYGYKYHGVYQNVEDTYMKDANGNVVYHLDGMPVIMTNNRERVYPGDAKYEDVNGDGNINQYDIVYLGNSNYKTMGGLLIELRYKNWRLNSQLYGRLGQKAINQPRMDNESMRGTNNQSTKVLERWRKEGDQTDIPRALYGAGYNYLGSDRFVEDASFFRIKTLSLRYNMPQNFLARYGMSQGHVFFTVYNLWTVTKYTGLDPEIEARGTYFPLAKDGAKTPQPIKFRAGLSVSF